MSYSDFYLATLLLGLDRAVAMADRKGLRAPTIIHYLNRAEDRRQRAQALA